MSKYYVVHYAEIALKGRNKPFYIDTLRKNLEFALSDVEGVSVKNSKEGSWLKLKVTQT
jgi:hypothetical protein